MRRTTSFHPLLLGISVGADAVRPRSASDADVWPELRPPAARCPPACLLPSDRLTPTTLRRAAAAIAHSGVRRAPPCVVKPIGRPHSRGMVPSVGSLLFGEPPLCSWTPPILPSNRARNRWFLAARALRRDN